MPQLPSVSELLGSTRVESAAGATVQTYPHSNSYDYNERKDSTTSISSTTISNDGYRRQSTDKSRHQRLPSISNTILPTNSKRNSIDTSPRSSVHLPSLSYSLIPRNESNNNITTNLESPPSSRRLTESSISMTTNNPAAPLVLPRTNSGNYLPNQSFKFQQPLQQQQSIQQHEESLKSGIVRPQVGSPIGSADKLQTLHMYNNSPSNLHMQPPPPPPPPLQPLFSSQTQSNSNTVSPTHNPLTLEIAADHINTATVPQHINLPLTTPSHGNPHGNPAFLISKSAPTSTTTTSYPLYFYQAAPPGDIQVRPPQEHYFTQHAPQATSIPTQTPPPTSSRNQNQVVAGPGYYIVQQPQQIPLPPTAPQQQVQAYAHPLPPHSLHHQAPLYQTQQGFHDQVHYDPHRPPASGALVGPPHMYAYNVPYSDENNALVNKRKIIKRRTRTGCLTCRKRRIKCDERKPSCFNCERLKKVCLGYENLSNLQPRKRTRDTSLDLPTTEGGATLNQQPQDVQQQVHDDRRSNGL